MQGNVILVSGLRQSHLFLAICKRWISYHYKLFVNIFHEFDLSYYFSHISDLRKKSWWKTKCFSQNCTIYRTIKKTHTNKRFFNSQFSYCPLIWMCQSRTNNKKINKLHKRRYRFIYNFRVTWIVRFCLYSHKEYSISSYWNVSW